MINYSKVRQSVEKIPSKKSLLKPNNKSHTNSIIKLKEDLRRDSTGRGWGHKKCSVKLQSNEKENLLRKKNDQPYDFTIFRPCQDTNRQLQTNRNLDNNRHLQTERTPKEIKIDRTPLKQSIRLRTDHSDVKQLRTDHSESKPFRVDSSQMKYIRTDYDCEQRGLTVRVPTRDLKRLMGELLNEQKAVSQLKKQLQFFRRHGSNGTLNSVLRCLKL